MTNTTLLNRNPQPSDVGAPRWHPSEQTPVRDLRINWQTSENDGRWQTIFLHLPCYLDGCAVVRDDCHVTVYVGSHIGVHRSGDAMILAQAPRQAGDGDD